MRSQSPYFFLRQFLRNARITKQTDNRLRPQTSESYKAGTFLRFDFKLFLIIWSIAVGIKAVLRLADAPILYTVVVILVGINS